MVRQEKYREIMNGFVERENLRILLHQYYLAGFERKGQNFTTYHFSTENRQLRQEMGLIKKKMMMGNRLIIDWYLNLPEPVRTQAMKNYDSTYAKESTGGTNQVDSLSYAILKGFIWESTPEGSKYWYNINIDILHPTPKEEKVKIGLKDNFGVEITEGCIVQVLKTIGTKHYKGERFMCVWSIPQHRYGFLYYEKMTKPTPSPKQFDLHFYATPLNAQKLKVLE